MWIRENATLIFSAWSKRNLKYYGCFCLFLTWYISFTCFFLPIFVTAVTYTIYYTVKMYIKNINIRSQIDTWCWTLADYCVDCVPINDKYKMAYSSGGWWFSWIVQVSETINSLEMDLNSICDQSFSFPIETFHAEYNVSQPHKARKTLTHLPLFLSTHTHLHAHTYNCFLSYYSKLYIVCVPSNLWPSGTFLLMVMLSGRFESRPWHYSRRSFSGNWEGFLRRMCNLL